MQAAELCPCLPCQLLLHRLCQSQRNVPPGVGQHEGLHGRQLVWLYCEVPSDVLPSIAPWQPCAKAIDQHPDMFESILANRVHPHKFGTHLVRALEGYALAQRTPDVAAPFSNYDPSNFIPSAPMTCAPSKVVKVLSFDGHAGVKRKFHSSWGEGPRIVKCKGGRPRKKYIREERTCPCASKDKQRITMKNRTAGWPLSLVPSAASSWLPKNTLSLNVCLAKWRWYRGGHEIEEGQC